MVCIETERGKSQPLTFEKVRYFETAIEWLLLTAMAWWRLDLFACERPALQKSFNGAAINLVCEISSSYQTSGPQRDETVFIGLYQLKRGRIQSERIKIFSWMYMCVCVVLVRVWINATGKCSKWKKWSASLWTQNKWEMIKLKLDKWSVAVFLLLWIQITEWRSRWNRTTVIASALLERAGETISDVFMRLCIEMCLILWHSWVWEERWSFSVLAIPLWS